MGFFKKEMLRTGTDKKGRGVYMKGAVMQVSDIKADRAEGVKAGHYNPEGTHRPTYTTDEFSKLSESQQFSYSGKKTKVAKLSASEEKKVVTLGKATITKKSLLGRA